MQSSEQHWERAVRVELGSRSYEIAIGTSILTLSGKAIKAWSRSAAGSAVRVFLVTDESVGQTHAETVFQSVTESGGEVVRCSIPSGESSKSSAQLQRLYDGLVDMTADRQTIVVAVGGGVTGDLAGYAAATYARGLRFLQVPTTLLAMVDSSVGGKTGINHPRGKNLIGAFHQPIGVLIDLCTLDSLPDREYRSGLAEVVKYGVILDPAFFEYLENHTAGLLNRDSAVLSHIVARSCELKAQVVSADEYETTGLRAVLNYGHTFAHAFESLSGYGSLLHGEAVSIGMVCASRLAESLGRVTSEDTERQIRLLEALSLPVSIPAGLVGKTQGLIECMRLDKKSQGGDLRFVLPDRIGHVEMIKGVPQTAVQAVLC